MSIGYKLLQPYKYFDFKNDNKTQIEDGYERMLPNYNNELKYKMVYSSLEDLAEDLKQTNMGIEYNLEVYKVITSRKIKANKKSYFAKKIKRIEPVSIEKLLNLYSKDPDNKQLLNLLAGQLNNGSHYDEIIEILSYIPSDEYMISFLNDLTVNTFINVAKNISDPKIYINILKTQYICPEILLSIIPKSGEKLNQIINLISRSQYCDSKVITAIINLIPKVASGGWGLLFLICDIVPFNKNLTSLHLGGLLDLIKSDNSDNKENILRIFSLNPNMNELTFVKLLNYVFSDTSLLEKNNYKISSTIKSSLDSLIDNSKLEEGGVQALINRYADKKESSLEVINKTLILESILILMKIKNQSSDSELPPLNFEQEYESVRMQNLRLIKIYRIRNKYNNLYKKDEYSRIYDIYELENEIQKELKPLNYNLKI